MGCNGLQAIFNFRWEEISGKQNVVTSEKRSWHGTSVMLVAWPIKTISDIAIHTLQGIVFQVRYIMVELLNGPHIKEQM